MRKPIFVRPFTETECQQLEAGLRSADACVLRRCQILLTSARGERTTQSARHLGCDDQTVRTAMRACHTVGVACSQQGSSRPHTLHAVCDPDRAARLRALLHQHPRAFGNPTSLGTLDLAAEVSFEPGLTPHQVTGETIRATLERLALRWQRAKHGLTSPDPAYARKKPATGSSAGRLTIPTGCEGVRMRPGGVASCSHGCMPGLTGGTRYAWWNRLCRKRTRIPRLWRALACGYEEWPRLSRGRRSGCGLSRGNP